MNCWHHPCLQGLAIATWQAATQNMAAVSMYPTSAMIPGDSANGLFDEGGDVSMFASPVGEILKHQTIHTMLKFSPKSCGSKKLAL